ncbi:hypothetical protein [Promicromonospora sukumoe]|uniref:hypothetical protein n=1 Tax=Promicromonospora sukumoe TaxID=88382 RepID=UPI001E5A86F3|nr:hypothetical protein [Promicromonospora sukumoe]
MSSGAERPALIRLGYWNGPHTSSGWPEPRDFVDPDWDEDERDEVHFYLSTGTVRVAFMGLSECRLCGERVGSLEYTDGVYVWPEGLAHYVEEHSVRLPAAVVEHVQARMEVLQKTPVDDTWWKAQTSWR